MWVFHRQEESLSTFSIYEFLWGAPTRPSNTSRELENHNEQRLDILSLSNQQLEVELETEQEIEAAINQFRHLLEKQQEKEKALIETRRKLVALFESKQRNEEDSAKVKFTLNIEIPIILDQIHEKILANEEKIELLENKLRSLRDERDETLIHKETFESEHPAIHDDIEASLMSNIVTQSSHIEVVVHEEHPQL
jgi:hypothetical protein